MSAPIGNLLIIKIGREQSFQIGKQYRAEEKVASCNIQNTGAKSKESHFQSIKGFTVYIITRDFHGLICQLPSQNLDVLSNLILTTSI